MASSANSASQDLHVKGCHPALQLPEILSEIISYVFGSTFFTPWSFTCIGNVSPETGLAPLFVCRQWHTVALGLLPRSSVWKWVDKSPSPSSHHAITDHVSIHRRLQCLFGVAQDAQESETNWQTLLSRLESVQKQPYELVIRGLFLSSTILAPLLRAPRFLRSISLLEISFDHHYAQVDLSLLLESNAGLTTTGLPNLKHLILRNVCVANTLENSKSHPPLAIASLCLYGVEIQKKTLDALMARLHGPSLDRLCIARATTTLAPPHANEALEVVSLVSVEDLIRWSKVFPYLRSIEVQLTFGPDFISALTQLQCLFPKAELLGIDYRGVPRPLRDGFIHTNSSLTMLEIQTKDWDGTFPVKHFSVFLCSDQACHLETLIAPCIEFPVKLLSANTTSTHDFADGAWRCRDLRHLYIHLAGRTSMDYNEDLRFVMAYFVANCPKLEHLELGREDVSLLPQGGVCLTSRLTHLKQLIFHVMYYVGHVASEAREDIAHSEEGLARWVLSHPTERDIELNQSSLRLCQAVSKLCPSVEIAQLQDPQAGEGCSWTQMELLRIEFGTTYYNRILLAREHMRMFKKLRPDISFEVELDC